MAKHVNGQGGPHGAPATWQCRCKCGARFTVTGFAGPSNLCDPCSAEALAAFWKLYDQARSAA